MIEYCKHMKWSDVITDYKCEYSIVSVSYCDKGHCQFYEPQDKEIEHNIQGGCESHNR